MYLCYRCIYAAHTNTHRAIQRYILICTELLVIVLPICPSFHQSNAVFASLPPSNLVVLTFDLLRVMSLRLTGWLIWSLLFWEFAVGVSRCLISIMNLYFCTDFAGVSQLSFSDELDWLFFTEQMCELIGSIYQLSTPVFERKIERKTKWWMDRQTERDLQNAVWMLINDVNSVLFVNSAWLAL